MGLGFLTLGLGFAIYFMINPIIIPAVGAYGAGCFGAVVVLTLAIVLYTLIGVVAITGLILLIVGANRMREGFYRSNTSE